MAKESKCVKEFDVNQAMDKKAVYTEVYRAYRDKYDDLVYAYVELLALYEDAKARLGEHYIFQK